ncbi:hypothetical protein C3Y92_05525 [Solidesulfovibrio carbinolicus]|uniref:WG repeat-containing protein n=2 Tax=Solidesulfovibrio carbinolicus TaxID=296842 RepID=A0A4P6HLE1_9BACT|nr:hypothetical protein C3Y92_05525 [Solidesulfovibrio carbinolicus]
MLSNYAIRLWPYILHFYPGLGSSMMENRSLFLKLLRITLIVFAIILAWVLLVGVFNMGPYVFLLIMTLAIWVLIPGILLAVGISLVITSMITSFKNIQKKKIPIEALGGIVMSIALAFPAYKVIDVYLGPKYSLVSILREKSKPSIGKVYLERAGDFKEGKARVEEKGTNYSIDRTGLVMPISRNTITVKYQTKWEPGVMTGTGFDDIEPGEGFEKVAKLDYNMFVRGTAGVIDNTSGQFVAQYDEIKHFYQNVAIAYNRGRPGLINKQGQWVIEPGVYKEIWPFQYGMARVRSGDNYGFIDENGKLVIDTTYNDARDFNDMGTAPVKKISKGGGNWGLISRDGTWILEPKYDEILRYGEGFYPVKDARMPKYGYCDWSGNEVMKPLYLQAKPFHEGLAAVHVDKEGWGYIDQSGNVVIPFQFYEANDFHEGLAAVRVDTRGSMLRQLFMNFFAPALELPGRWGYIDRNGNLVISTVVHSKPK